MATPDWQALRVVLNERAAIFAEHFPASLTSLGPEIVSRFTHEQAQGLLYTFAGAWPVLGRDGSDPSVRYVFEAFGDQVFRFRGIELAPGAIVVDDVASPDIRS